MDVVNRIVILLLSVVAVVTGVIGLLLLGGVVTPTQVSPGNLLHDQWAFFAGLNGAATTTAAIVLVALTVIGLIFLILELLPTRREPAQYLIKRDGLGSVTVARKSIGALVQHEAAAVDGVREVRPEVRDTPQGLHVLARASLFPEADAAAVGETLQARIQQAVQRHVGLPVAEVQVATQLESLDGSRVRRRVQ